MMERVLDRFSLAGRVAVVTGGNRGIGLACAAALGEAGATVVIAGRDAAAGQSALATLASGGVAARWLPLDVTDVDAVDAAATRVVADHGQVDVLVANAGILSTAPSLDLADAEWRRILDTNVNGTFWCMREFGRPMLARGRGSVIAVGSMSGLIVNKPRPMAAYNTSKAAIHMTVRHLAIEWARSGVRVNAVAPG